MFLRYRSFVSHRIHSLFVCIILLSVLSWTHMSWAKKRVLLDRIVAVVNGDIVLWSEWKQRVDTFKTRLGKTLDEGEKKKRLEKLKMQIINKMVDDKLLEQNAAKLQISVSDKEVQAAVLDTQKKHNLTPEQFRIALREQGYTMLSYEMMLRRELSKLRLLQRVLRQKVTVSEEEIRKYYADMTRGIKPGPPEYRVRQIMFMVPPKSTTAVVAQKKSQAQKVLNLAQKKQNVASFIALIKRFSDGPWKDKDGDLGYLGPDSLPKPIADISSKLVLNRVYPKVIHSTSGFHIVFLQGKRNSGVLSYAEAKPKIQKKLQQVAFQREYKRYVKDLRRKAVIELRLKDPSKKS